MFAMNVVSQNKLFCGNIVILLTINYYYHFSIKTSVGACIFVTCLRAYERGAQFSNIYYLEW